jgi:Sigma-70 region 2
MATGQLTKFIDRLRGALVKQDAAASSDGELLKLYLRQREEAAFEALVRRHGPMVMGVCQRVLHNSHDAEDAFQATFLVLVRKASTLRSPGRTKLPSSRIPNFKLQKDKAYAAASISTETQAFRVEAFCLSVLDSLNP